MSYNSNILQISILIYLLFVGIILYIKPNMFFYNGKLKQFGTNNKKNKTLFPLWLVFLLGGILSYYFSHLIYSINYIESSSNMSEY